MARTQFTLLLSVMGFSALIPGCATSSPSSSTDPVPPPSTASSNAPARVNSSSAIASHKTARGAFRREGRLGTYVSSPWGFSTNSFVVEGDDGLVLIDTQFMPSAAIDVVEQAEAAFGKKVSTAVVLHANPDKFNGTEALQKRGIRVITSQQVVALIPHVHEIRTRAFAKRYAPDYPTAVPSPDVFGDATATLNLHGRTLTLHVLGAGCSEAHVIVTTDDGDLFAGDLVASGAHSWLEIGRTDAWLQRVDDMEVLQPNRVHPGRGPSGGPDLLQAQRSYLQDAIAAVAAESPSLPIDKVAVQRARAAMTAKYPDHRFAVFLRIGLPAEFKRQASLASPGPASTPAP